MKKLSATIISFNEEKYIGKCLHSLEGVADEIVVVDSFSTDKTTEICKSHGVRLFSRAFPGYRDQKNYATSLAKYDYIFSIDADEEVTPELKESLIRFKGGEMGEYDAFLVNRLNRYRDNWIRHCGWYPDRKLRLYDRTKGSWGGYNIHEVVMMDKDTRTGRLSGDLLHRIYDNIDEFAAKANNYATISAREYFNHGRRSGSLKAMSHMIWSFLRNYFIKGGMLDGRSGLIICTMTAYSVFLKYIKLMELEKNNLKED